MAVLMLLFVYGIAADAKKKKKVCQLGLLPASELESDVEIGLRAGSCSCARSAKSL